MAANKMTLLNSITFLACVALGSDCVAQTKTVKPQEVLKYASLNVVKAVAEYEKRIGYCTDLISSSQSPTLDKARLAALKISREDAILAVAALDFRNSFLCEQEQRLKLAFQLGTLKSLKKELNQEIEQVEDAQSIVSYPSKRELELEVKYLALPRKVRDYFEDTIGYSPFDMVDALEANKLMRE